MKSQLHRRGNKTLTKLFVEREEIDVREHCAHEEVSAYYAPSECHGDVNRSYDRERAEFEKRIGMTGVQLYRKFQNFYQLNDAQMFRLCGRLSGHLWNKQSVYGRAA